MASPAGARAIDVTALADGVRRGERAALSRAITVVESTRADHRQAARELLDRLLGRTGTAWRVGISGVPGAGKSTFIETLGAMLTADGHRVGVLAIDPSSVRTGGSVLGDKTRMPALAANPDAFIRPSPSAGTLGGVTRATAQTIPLLEAAGYDVVLVETVGVGQSETTAASMVDTFLLLGLARSGDQLQGIKRGVLEIADVIAINKADGPGEADARDAARELSGAMRLVYAAGQGWVPPVVTCSGLTGAGVDELWELVRRHRDHLGDAGLAAKRSRQQWDLTRTLVTDAVLARLRTSPGVERTSAALRPRVLDGSMTAVAAADEILAAFDDEAPAVGPPGIEPAD